MRMRIGQFINTRSVSRTYAHRNFLTRCVFVQFSSDSILLQAAVSLSYSFASKYNWHKESFSYSAAGGLMFSGKSVTSIDGGERLASRSNGLCPGDRASRTH